jgi:adenosylcobyric acid synthase
VAKSLRAKSLMIMGTASDVGKSVVVAALGRAFARAGVRVAPFKSQNMSNNSAVCAGGGEIGRAQAMQAEACGLAPTLDMNPVLLKPETDTGCQVVIRGRARFQMGVRDYDRYRREAWPEIVASYESLAAEFELVLIEGAGGAAEVNLKDRDIVNWAVAELAAAPVVLVADIDKGGVFASLVGTVELIQPSERDRVRGMLINKFRGDVRLLDSGLRFLEERTGIPVLGVLPHINGLRLPDEDAARLDYLAPAVSVGSPVTIGVVHLPRISNYTDFEPLEHEPDVTVHYLTDPASAPALDVLILPGTKSTVSDLSWLRRAGWETAMVRHLRGGGRVIGICGGFQMLGRRILDPHGVESKIAESIGLGLLDLETVFERDKITAQVEGYEVSSGLAIRGYEIHAGRAVRAGESEPLLRITKRGGADLEELEGCKSADGRVIGTSIHGLFDSAGFRRRFIDIVRSAKGLEPLGDAPAPDYREVRTAEYDRLADVLIAHADFARIASIAGIRI